MNARLTAPGVDRELTTTRHEAWLVPKESPDPIAGRSLPPGQIRRKPVRRFKPPRFVMRHTFAGNRVKLSMARRPISTSPRVDVRSIVIGCTILALLIVAIWFFMSRYRRSSDAPGEPLVPQTASHS